MGRSQRGACRAIGLNRSTLQYKPHGKNDEPLKQEISKIVQQRRRFGQNRVYRVLRRSGWPDNHKRVSRVYGVVTFYSFFTMMPRGKHTVRACMGTACYVKGGKAVVEAIEKEFHVKEGQTTADRLFTFETVRCIGACGLAPAVIVNEDVHGGVKPSEVKGILSKYN